MFPIRDPRGRVIGFGGRVMGDGEPKYLNSPETPVFHKGRSLYGLYEARQVQGRPEEILVVEGYLDVASLSQHGIEPSVATLGTATTAEHIRRLTRLTDRVIFCFDGDKAGRKAAWRALETALPHAGGAVELKFLLLPDGQDPDSLVRERGTESFRALLPSARQLSEFMLEELQSKVDLDSADGRSRLTALVGPLLERLPMAAS
jgi:DNA primase